MTEPSGDQTTAPNATTTDNSGPATTCADQSGPATTPSGTAGPAPTPGGQGGRPPCVLMIGAGGIAHAHLPAWLGLGAKVWIYSLEGAPEIAAEIGGTAVGSFEEALDQVDIVDVCTPTPFHREYIEKAAAAGKNVISEKPLSRTSADARAAIEACRAAGVQLYPGHVVRFFSEYETMHGAVANGTIGEIAVQRFTRTGSRPDRDWFHDEAQSGGIIMDQMIHDLDFARWNAGEVKTVFARKTVVGTGKDALVSAQVVLTHTSGAISYVGGTWARPGTTFRTTFEIAGTGGILTHDSTQYKPLVIDGGSQSKEGTGLLPAVHGVSPFATEIGEFAAAFGGGDTPRVSAEDGLAAIVIAEAAIESLQTGQPVPVPNDAVAQSAVQTGVSA